MPANGMKYSPAQMQQLNAARDALRATEATGVYGVGGTGGIDPSKVQWDQQPSPSSQPTPDADAIKRAMAAREIASASPFGMGPDIAMGARQAFDAVRQMIGHATGNGQSSDQAANAALADYNKAYQPQAFTGSDVARGAGQMLTT